MTPRILPKLATAALAAIIALAPAHARQQPPAMKIRIVTGTEVALGELDDSAAARDFLALLPLKLTLTDYAETEKVADLPVRLTTGGSPPGMAPTVGDITYYAPWGNLAIFIRDFGHSRGLVKLGRITSGLRHIGRAGPVPVTIERMTD
ncbi:cyclophilin-like fold protein [Pleomorphomonas sp. NRK KF1]|uniref:cyclophilin-like fold protein n=1 Tax=Pleomorphomonas sp. NRK KF1 TaxID=2943000 RepID=UPI002044B3BF|nr:cyclophilin-like fold protein [Pleomorphomonas sp. NRK KF1]MCM5555281.1 cyclophilin-like fold protein [Pleomorphomonas sp. NRK KF1]